MQESLNAFKKYLDFMSFQTLLNTTETAFFNICTYTELLQKTIRYLASYLEFKNCFTNMLQATL